MKRAEELLTTRRHRSRRFEGRYVYLELARRLDELADRYLDGRGVLLDYGCGETPFRGIFGPRVDEYRAADLPANPLADLHLDDEARLPVRDGAADVVLSTQVLEHVEDPSLYLAECARVLCPGGLLFLSTHGHWPYHPHPSDHWRWTHTGLRKIVDAAGFQTIEVRGVLNLLLTSLQMFQVALSRGCPRWLSGPVTVLNQNLLLPALGAFLAGRNVLDAATLVLVARRSGGTGLPES